MGIAMDSGAWVAREASEKASCFLPIVVSWWRFIQTQGFELVMFGPLHQLFRNILKCIQMALFFQGAQTTQTSFWS